MSRLFTVLCLAIFTLAAPACDDNEPKDPGSSTGEGSSGGASSTGEPDEATIGDEAGTTDEMDEFPGATLATPHVSTGS